MRGETGASSHLGIPLEEYDLRIRTFVPFYETMLGELEALVESMADPQPVILDLGIGTGALAERCLHVRPRARVVGVDTDPEMLVLARDRLRGFGGVEFLPGSFLEIQLPAADLIVSSLSFHHVSTAPEKQALYRRCREALGDRGPMLLADCFLPGTEGLARRGMVGWQGHLEESYTPEESRDFLEAWSEEDTYFRLADELDWLRSAGFRPEVIWRKDLFAVLLCL